jgi:hypothetical protein
VPVAADTTNATVTVTCTDFTDDFSVTLSAEAASAADCSSSDADTAYVTVNTQPEVTIERLTNVTTFCVEGDGSAVSVKYQVSSGAANSSLEVVADAPSEAGCSVTGPTGATNLDHQALWVLLLGMQPAPRMGSCTLPELPVLHVCRALPTLLTSSA